MGAFTHCPSCGAPAQGQFCEYCGTPLFTTGDSLIAMQGKRCHIWFENDDGTIHLMDLFVQRADLDADYTTVYADDGPYHSFATQENLTIEATLVDWNMDDWKKVIEWQKGRLENG